MGPELTVWLLHLCGWAVGWLLVFRVPSCRNTQARTGGPVTVIIPARNEEENLPALLESLWAQRPPAEEILVVDDGSTDRTAEIARQAGVRLLQPPPLPDGWRGKAWACQQGAEAALNETLVFMDADTRFETGGLAAVRDLFGRTGGALSLAAFQQTGRASEQLSAFFVWVMCAATGAFTPLRRARGLLGPFLIVSKADYQRAGGHAAVKARVLENYYLATCFANIDVPVTCVGGQGVLSVRMYADGLGAVYNGWKKAFASGARKTPPLLLAGIILWLSAAAGTAIMLAVSVWSGYSLLLWGALYIAFVRQLHRQLRRLGMFSLWTACFYPLSLLFFFGVFAQSALARQSAWKGRVFREEAP